MSMGYVIGQLLKRKECVFHIQNTIYKVVKKTLGASKEEKYVTVRQVVCHMLSKVNNIELKAIQDIF
jgi:fibronectin type 3 domain-containing protein